MLERCSSLGLDSVPITRGLSLFTALNTLPDTLLVSSLHFYHFPPCNMIRLEQYVPLAQGHAIESRQESIPNTTDYQCSKTQLLFDRVLLCCDTRVLKYSSSILLLPCSTSPLLCLSL